MKWIIDIIKALKVSFLQKFLWMWDISLGNVNTICKTFPTAKYKSITLTTQIRKCYQGFEISKLFAIESVTHE